MSVHFVPVFSQAAISLAQQALGIVNRTISLAANTSQARLLPARDKWPFAELEHYVFVGDPNQMTSELEEVRDEAYELQNDLLASSKDLPPLEWQALSKYLTRVQRTATAYRKGEFTNKPLVAEIQDARPPQFRNSSLICRHDPKLGHALYQLMGIPFITEQMIPKSKPQEGNTPKNQGLQELYIIDEAISNAGLGVLGLKLGLSTERHPLSPLHEHLNSDKLGDIAVRAALHVSSGPIDSDPDLWRKGYIVGTDRYVESLIQASREYAKKENIESALTNYRGLMVRRDADVIAAASRFEYGLTYY